MSTMCESQQPASVSYNNIYGKFILNINQLYTNMYTYVYLRLSQLVLTIMNAPFPLKIISFA